MDALKDVHEHSKNLEFCWKIDRTWELLSIDEVHDVGVVVDESLQLLVLMLGELVTIHQIDAVHSDFVLKEFVSPFWW